MISAARSRNAGNRISHAHNVTKRRWNVNLRPVHAKRRPATTNACASARPACAAAKSSRLKQLEPQRREYAVGHSRLPPISTPRSRMFSQELCVLGVPYGFSFICIASSLMSKIKVAFGGMSGG